MVTKKRIEKKAIRKKRIEKPIMVDELNQISDHVKRESDVRIVSDTGKVRKIDILKETKVYDNLIETKINTLMTISSLVVTIYLSTMTLWMDNIVLVGVFATLAGLNLFSVFFCLGVVVPKTKHIGNDLNFYKLKDLNHDTIYEFDTYLEDNKHDIVNEIKANSQLVYKKHLIFNISLNMSFVGTPWLFSKIQDWIFGY